MAKKVEIEQTEIEAPYELPDGWKWIPLLESFENKTSSNKKLPTKDYLNSGKFAVVDQGQEFIGGYSNKSDFVFDGELPIILFGDHTKCIKYIDFPFIQGADGVKILKPISIVDSKFFYYALQNIHFPDLGYRRHFPIFKDYLFPLPPTLAEQQRIVNRIETMFAKLDQAQEKAQAVLDSFETRKATILHKAFTGELTANWRKENGVPDDSWEEKCLGEISSKITDGEHSTPKRVDDFCGYYLLSARNIHNGEILLDDVDYVAKEEYERIRKRCNPEKRDILISCSGSVGRVCVIQDENKYVMVRSAAMVKLEKDNPFYVAYMLQSFNVQQQIERTKKQSCQANLFLGAIKELTIPMPTYTEQIEIVKIIDRIIENEEKAKQAAEIVLQQIDILKKSILARAFRGEI